ncbi:MAG: S41 family peptidase [Pirellulales bacterium]|nr:S41 family peptidase [Pirellulales bacterium]
MRKRLVSCVVLAGLLLGFSLPSGVLADPAAAPAADAAAASQDEYYELYKVLVDTMDQVERNYVQDISRRELIEAAIQGVLQKLDPYSSYISREEMSRFRDSVESRFGGIGIQVGIEDGHLIIHTPLVGTPAYRAGLRSGDRITAIEGESTEGITIDQAVQRLKGEAGTEVHITVLHPGDEETEEVALKREVIEVETVLGDHRNEDDSWNFLLDEERKIGYVRITAFSRETADELHQAMDSLTKQGLRGLILDLRFNPGGLLTSAIEVSDMFIADGRIVSTKGRNTDERVWDAEKPGTYEGFPMVVLVNQYSASASEIVSACLQDHGRAIIVGQRTWGKGSVQNVVELEGGLSALKLTTASYQRPNGHNIHRFPDAKESDEWGVKPNDGFEVKLDDEQLLAMVEHRRQRDVVQRHGKPGQDATQQAGDEAGKTEADDPASADPQLRKALEYLRSQMSADQS